MATLTTFGSFDKDGFLAVIAKLYPDGQIAWQGDAQPFPGPNKGKPGEILLLDMVRVITQGVEDTTKDYDAATGALNYTYTGNCVFIVNFRMESYSFDFPAYDRLRSVVLRLRRQGTLNALEDLGLSYAMHHAIVVLPLVADQRQLYCATCDVEFNGLTIESDETADGGVIQTVGGWSGPVGATGALPGVITFPSGATGPV